MEDVILVRTWDPETFYQRVVELERQGYIARQGSYRITPEVNPETGQIIHLRSVEMILCSPCE
jgi:hypothetical protein